MIKKNGDNKWTVDIGMVITVIVIIAGIVTSYWKTNIELNGSISAVEKEIKEDVNEVKLEVAKIGITVKNNKENIQINMEDIKHIEEKIQ